MRQQEMSKTTLDSGFNPRERMQVVHLNAPEGRKCPPFFAVQRVCRK
jgi:hypothetical protein